MRFQLAVVFSLLASAWAAPGLERSIFDRDVCNADNCLRAVRASSAKPGPSSATADCSSFFRKTVTPCAATTYVTATTVITGSPTSVTATTLSTELDVTTTITTITTATATTTIALNKRVETSVSDAFLAYRAVTSTCPATTNAPSNVPVYASACSGTVRYSSACSCAGISAMTTTLSQVTVVSTTTLTSFTTSTASLTATSTYTSTLTNTATSTQSTTLSVTPTACAIQAVDGNKAGQYLNSNANNVFTFTSSLDSALFFFLGSDGSLQIQGSGGRSTYAQPGVSSLVIGLTADQANQPAYQAGRILICSFTGDTLTCNLNGGPVAFGTTTDNFLRAGGSNAVVTLNRVSCR